MPRPAAPSATTEAAVRAHFGLSQQQLARYLGVSTGFVTHLEAGRKPLPLALLARLTRLALLLPPPEGHGPPLPPPASATPTNPAALPTGPATPLAAAPLHKRVRACRLRAAVLGQQLARLHARAAAHFRRAQGLAQLQAALGPDAAEARWLRELAEDVAAAAPGPAAASAQVLLAVRVAALTAEADTLESLLKSE